jgi:TatD DNase family protein
MHCFTGTAQEAQALLELGLYISFSGIVTFKSAQALREVARRVPLERMLVETDCPFLTPVPYRGKRNEPAYVVRVAQTLAQVKDRPLSAVAEATAKNTRTLFRLPG